VTDAIHSESTPSFFGRDFKYVSSVLRSCALALLVLATGVFATAADQKSASNPCNISSAEAAGLNHDLSTDLQTGNVYVATIARILKEERFDVLDCLADHARSGKERFSGGAWKLSTLYVGLTNPVQYPIVHATQQDWNVLLQRLQHWTVARPNSITAPVALALANSGFAYDARGESTADTVTESGWKLFEERMTEANRILEQASTLPTKCPEWYLAMLDVARNRGWDATHSRALFEEASKFEPGYSYFAQALAYSLTPRWGGEAGGTEKFSQEVADRVGGDQGDILYFQIASANYIVRGTEDDPKLSWERIVRGYEASEKQYGTSLSNLNRMAYLAMSFAGGDVVFANKAITRIGEQWDKETWGSKEYFDQVKQLAAEQGPRMAEIFAIEAAAKSNAQTPEGARYQIAFEKTYRELLRQCAITHGGTPDAFGSKFESLTKVGAKGTVEDMKISAMGPIAACLDRELKSFQQARATPFPPPPQTPYWIRLDLDWADYTPVATK